MKVLKGAELARNLVLNPALRVDAAGWSSGGTISRVSFNGKWWLDAAAGTYTYASASGVAGQYYAASLRLNGSPGAVITINSTDNASGPWCETPAVTIPAGGEVVVRLASTAAAVATNLAFGVLVDAGEAVKITEALIQNVPGSGVLPVDYFDGSTPDTETRVYDWAAAADGSASVMYERIPNLVVEPLAAGPWAGVTVQGLEPGTHVLTVWRTAGGIRQAVRGALDLEVLDSAYVIDYEVPLGRVVTYELEILEGPDAGAVVPNVDVTVSSASGFIHDPLDPTVVVPVWATRAPSGEPVLAGTAFREFARGADVAVHNVMGSSLPVAIGGQRRAASGFDMSVLTDAEAQNMALRDLLNNSATPVVRLLPGWLGDVLPPVAYVALPEVIESPLSAHQQSLTGKYLTRWQMVGQVVRPSSAAVLIALFTYQDVQDVFATYEQKQASAGGRTYLDDLKNPLGA